MRALGAAPHLLAQCWETGDGPGAVLCGKMSCLLRLESVSGLLLGVRRQHDQGRSGDEWRLLQSLVVREVLPGHTSSLVGL